LGSSIAEALKRKGKARGLMPTRDAIATKTWGTPALLAESCSAARATTSTGTTAKVVRGAEGISITYDAAGQRQSATAADGTFVSVASKPS
jgi:YD repeat-containing protein